MKYNHTSKCIIAAFIVSLSGTGYALAYGVQPGINNATAGQIKAVGTNVSGNTLPKASNKNIKRIAGESVKPSSVNPNSLIINNSNTLKKLSEANAKHALLTARLANAELEEQILKIDRKNSLPSGGSNGGGILNSFKDVRNIRVLLLTGFEKNYSATLEFGKKQYINVHSNSILPNGWVVQSVTSDGVFLKTDKGPMELPFGGGPTDRDNKKGSHNSGFNQTHSYTSKANGSHGGIPSFNTGNSTHPNIPSFNGGIVPQHH
jgi:type IV pilus biogenesis protein PilP